MLYSSSARSIFRTIFRAMELEVRRTRGPSLLSAHITRWHSCEALIYHAQQVRVLQRGCHALLVIELLIDLVFRSMASLSDLQLPWFLGVRSSVAIEWTERIKKCTIQLLMHSAIREQRANSCPLLCRAAMHEGWDTLRHPAYTISAVFSSIASGYTAQSKLPSCNGQWWA